MISQIFKVKSLSIILAVSTIAVSLLRAEQALSTDYPEQILVLQGRVEIEGEDEGFNTTAVSLSVDTVSAGKDITIYFQIDLNSGKGAELLKKVGKKLRVTGQARRDRAGVRYLLVTEYESASGFRSSSPAEVQTGGAVENVDPDGYEIERGE